MIRFLIFLLLFAGIGAWLIRWFVVFTKSKVERENAALEKYIQEQAEELEKYKKQKKK